MPFPPPLEPSSVSSLFGLIPGLESGNTALPSDSSTVCPQGNHRISLGLCSCLKEQWLCLVLARSPHCSHPHPASGAHLPVSSPPLLFPPPFSLPHPSPSPFFSHPLILPPSLPPHLLFLSSTFPVLPPPPAPVPTPAAPYPCQLAGPGSRR